MSNDSAGYSSGPVSDGGMDPRNDKDRNLLDDLHEAERANGTIPSCQACDALAAVSESARPGLKQALAGTIGSKKLAAILTRNGYPTGRRAIDRHRQEGHS